MAKLRFRSAHGMAGGEMGLDDDLAMTWSTNIGATIMGRNGPLHLRCTTSENS